MEGICQKERCLANLTAEGLKCLPGVHVFAQPGLPGQVGVLSFTVDGWDCEELAFALGEKEVAVRAGLHCAPLAHRTGGTFETGTVRVSFSDFNTEREVRSFLDLMRGILKA